MQAVKLIHIVACTTTGMIGHQGQIPWRIAADFKHFKTTTHGGVIVMGRKTLESLPGILPGREHFVLTRDEHFEKRFRDGMLLRNISAEEVSRVHIRTNFQVLIEDAIACAAEKGLDKVFIIGGGELYERTLPMISQAIITLVPFEDEELGDTWYPLQNVMNSPARKMLTTNYLKGGAGAVILDIYLETSLVGKCYQHYKGELYQIIQQCAHADTNVQYIVYQHIESKRTWTLPYGEFFKTIKGPSRDYERFAEIKGGSCSNFPNKPIIGASTDAEIVAPVHRPNHVFDPLIHDNQEEAWRGFTETSDDKAKEIQRELITQGLFYIVVDGILYCQGVEGECVFSIQVPEHLLNIEDDEKKGGCMYLFWQQQLVDVYRHKSKQPLEHSHLNAFKRGLVTVDEFKIWLKAIDAVVKEHGGKIALFEPELIEEHYWALR